MHSSCTQCIFHFRNSAPVAQLDRVPGFEPGGREFESLRARQENQKLNADSGSSLSRLSRETTFIVAPIVALGRRVEEVGHFACRLSARSEPTSRGLSLPIADQLARPDR